MHKCEMEFRGRLALFCGDRATIKIEGRWYCQIHATAVEEAQIRWSGINWFPIRYAESHVQPDLNDPDGRFWDDGTEE